MLQLNSKNIKFVCKQIIFLQKNSKMLQLSSKGKFKNYFFLNSNWNLFNLKNRQKLFKDILYNMHLTNYVYLSPSLYDLRKV